MSYRGLDSGVLQCVVALHPALAVLQVAYDSYTRIKHSKEQCKALMRRAEHILRDINQAMRDQALDPGEENLKRLKQKLKVIRTLMKTQSERRFWDVLIRGADIDAALGDGHRALNDCIDLFHIRAELKIQSTLEAFEKERRKDVSRIEEICKQVLQEQQSQRGTLQDLNVTGSNPDTAKEIMIAMGRRLQDEPENAIRRRAMSYGLQYLQSRTNISIKGDEYETITTYEIQLIPEAELGRGSFAEVVLARWQGIMVAVKRMKRGQVREFKRELDIWRGLQHDNIVPCYGASLAADPPFIVLKYMQNGDLLQYLRRTPDANRAKLLHDVALGLLFLHSKQVVHGDVKSGNVLIDDAGKACVTDFGLAIKYQPTGDGKDRSHPVGTLRFMAPETITQGLRTYASDVFAFGMLMYETYTHRLPHSDARDADVASGKLVLSRPTSEQAISRGLNDDVWDLHQSCTSPMPEKRLTAKMISAKLAEIMYTYVVDPSLPKLNFEIIALPSSTSIHVQGSSYDASLLAVPSALSDGTSASRKAVATTYRLQPVVVYNTITRSRAKMSLDQDGCPRVTKDGDHELCYPKDAQYNSSNSNSEREFTAEVPYGSLVCIDRWEIVGTTISRTGELGASAWRFESDILALHWFRLLRSYAEKKPEKAVNAMFLSFTQVSEGTDTIVDWTLRTAIWRRAAGGIRKEALVILAERDKPPPVSNWMTCRQPPRCLTRNQLPLDATGADNSASYTVYSERTGAPSYTRMLELCNTSVRKIQFCGEDDTAPFKVEEDKFDDAGLASTWFALWKIEHDDEAIKYEELRLRSPELRRRRSLGSGYSPGHSLANYSPVPGFLHLPN